MILETLKRDLHNPGAFWKRTNSTKRRKTLRTLTISDTKSRKQLLMELPLGIHADDLFQWR